MNMLELEEPKKANRDLNAKLVHERLESEQLKYVQTELTKGAESVTANVKSTIGKLAHQKVLQQKREEGAKIRQDIQKATRENEFLNQMIQHENSTEVQALLKNNEQMLAQKAEFEYSNQVQQNILNLYGKRRLAQIENMEKHKLLAAPETERNKMLLNHYATEYAEAEKISYENKLTDDLIKANQELRKTKSQHEVKIRHLASSPEAESAIQNAIAQAEESKNFVVEIDSKKDELIGYIQRYINNNPEYYSWYINTYNSGELPVFNVLSIQDLNAFYEHLMGKRKEYTQELESRAFSS